MEWEQVAAWCPRAADLFDAGESWTVEDPLAQKSWTAPDGTTWRRRGDGEIDPRDVRRLLRRRNPRVFHVYDTPPHEHSGPGLDVLVAHLEDFWAGRHDPHDELRVGEFRSADGDVLLVVQQFC